MTAMEVEDPLFHTATTPGHHNNHGHHSPPQQQQHHHHQQKQLKQHHIDHSPINKKDFFTPIQYNISEFVTPTEIYKNIKLETLNLDSDGIEFDNINNNAEETGHIDVDNDDDDVGDNEKETSAEVDDLMITEYKLDKIKPTDKSFPGPNLVGNYSYKHHQHHTNDKCLACILDGNADGSGTTNKIYEQFIIVDDDTTTNAMLTTKATIPPTIFKPTTIINGQPKPPLVKVPQSIITSTNSGKISEPINIKMKPTSLSTATTTKATITSNNELISSEKGETTNFYFVIKHLPNFIYFY